MRSIAITTAMFCLALIVASIPAQAKRIALIIGNDAYSNVTPLKKAVNDAVAISSTLIDLGFKADLHQNLDRRAMNSALANFTAKIEKGDEVLFYFSGHGIAVRGENYLLPTDVPKAVPGQEDFITREAFAEEEIILSLKSKGARVAILILDACRNNPFPRKGTRSIGHSVGLGRTSAPPEGTFVMYSAGVGQEALDRLSDDDPHPNSVYTRKLIPLMKEQGLQIVRVAKRLRSEVEALAKTAKGGAHPQYPSYYDELRGDFFFIPGERKETTPVTSAEENLWRTIEHSKSASDFEFYLKEHPSGRFSSIAKLRLNQLNRKPGDKKTSDEKQKTSADQLWSKLKSSSSPANLASFIRMYPDSEHVPLAKELIHEIITQRERETALLGIPKTKPKTQLKTKALAYKPGDTFLDCEDCPEMIVLPAGNYMMGQKAKKGDKFRITEPLHTVTIAKPFAIGKYEVTRQEYERFVARTGHDFGNLCWTIEGGRGKNRKNRSYRVTGFARIDTHPTVCINWHDAKAYVEWLNDAAKQSGKQGTYRLPTEAEWEYAARAGKTTKYPYGNNTKILCKYGNHAAREVNKSWKNKACNDGHKILAPRGTYKPNAFGIYDMLGNASEWLEDCTHFNYKGAPTDGSAWLSANRGECTKRIQRGGTFNNAPESLTAGARHYTKTTERTIQYGFRVVKDLE